jgi:phosphatidylglycerophosphatase A
MSFIALALATALGIGYVPFAPGTFGTAAGLLLWWLLPHDTATQVLVIIIVFFAGAWGGSVAERHFKRTDPGHVVIDEVLGALITLVFNPVGWMGAILGFFFFRFTDIVKPFPARRLENLHGGLGIMADDAMAAVYSNLMLRVAIIVAHAFHWTL